MDQSGVTPQRRQSRGWQLPTAGRGPEYAHGALSASHARGGYGLPRWAGHSGLQYCRMLASRPPSAATGEINPLRDEKGPP